MAYWMAIAFAVIKMFHFGLPVSWRPTPLWHYTSDLLVATATDNLFAIVVGIVAALSLTPLTQRPRGHWIACAGWASFCAACVLFAIASGYVFSETRAPITRDLIIAAGNWGDMRSSLAAYLEPWTISALCTGTLSYLLIVWASHRYVGVPRRGTSRVVLFLLAAGVAGQYAYAQSNTRQWMRRDDRSISENPHWALLSGYIGLRESKLNVPRDIPAAYDADFVPLRERSAGPGGHNSHAVTRGDRPRHVIVYVLESVDTQFLHLYGSHYPTTPHLDAEAAHALVLDNMYCHVGRSAQSMVGISNSNFARTNWQPNIYDPVRELNQPGISLAEVLKGHGFRTLALGSANLADFKQLDFLASCHFDQVWDKRDLPGKDISTWGKADGPLVDKLLEWIDQDRAHAEPFFALCWTNQTHHPYALSPGQVELDLLGQGSPIPQGDQQAVNRYLNCLVETDQILQRMLNGLRERGLADDTLVVFVGDHGEAFHWPHNTGFHGYRVYEENVHVPCMLWNPRLFSPGKRLATVAGHIDLSPTITDLLGFEPAPTWQGHSIFDPASPARAYFYASYDDYYLGVRQGEWKYIYNATTGFDELYNLRLDPQEKTDVFADHPQICRELRGRVGAWVSHLNRYGAGVKP